MVQRKMTRDRSLMTLTSLATRLYAIQRINGKPWMLFYFTNYINKPTKFLACKSSDFNAAEFVHNRIPTIEGDSLQTVINKIGEQHEHD